MKTFNDILNELAEPKARKEKEFKDKHIVQKMDHPVTDMDALTAKSMKKDKTKKASLHDDEDEAVYEEVEQIDEISKKTLGSYIKKASDRVARNTAAYDSVHSGEMSNRGTFKDRLNYKKELSKDTRKRKAGMDKAVDRLTKEEVELDEDITKMSHGRLKWHMNTGVPHGSYTKDEMKKERDRRLSRVDTHAAYKKAKAGLSEAAPKIKHMIDTIKKEREKNREHDAAMGRTPTGRKKPVRSMTSTQKSMASMRNEEAEQIDEISKKTLGSYINKSARDMTSIQRAIGSGGGIKSPDYKDLSRMRKNRETGIATAVKKLTKEEIELDEAVEVSHDRYMRSHGKRASGGHGMWMFTHKRMGDANVNDPKEVHSASGKFADAKKSAQQWAKKHGHSTVYVMEEVELDEVLDTPKAMQSYKNKANRSLDRASNSAIAKMLRNPKGPQATDISKETETMDKRKKGLKMADRNAARKTFKALRKEEYMDEAFKAGSMKLKDGSSVKVTSEQASSLNALFNELNSSNKKKMEERLMSSSKGFNEILSFAKEAL